MGSTLSARELDFLLRCYADFDVQRRRYNRPSTAWGQAASAQLLGRLARLREGRWQPPDDPLLRGLGIWRSNLTAPHTLASLEFDEVAARLDTIPPEPTPASLSHRALAAWACRLHHPQSELLPICLQIRDEVRIVGRSTYSFPTAATAAWLTWFSTAYALDFPIPGTFSDTETGHKNRWQKLAFGSQMAGRVANTLQEIQSEDRRKHTADQYHATRSRDATGRPT